MKRDIPSNLKPRNYCLSEIYRIINKRQATLFIKHGVFPIDIYHSLDKDSNDILVYVFLRNDCVEVFSEWNNHTLV